MKKYHFNDMAKGWFIGDFSPCAFSWKGGEISVKHFPRGYVERGRIHENAIKYYVVMKGKLLLGGRIVEERQIASIEPEEDASLAALENTVALLSVVGDHGSIRSGVHSLAEELKLYNSIYTHRGYEGSIDFGDISVVVQGAVNKKITPVCMESIRHFLPGSRIILSTWEGSDVEGIDRDELVLNKDPGAYIDKMGYPNNVNRQLASTQNGLGRVKSNYVLKLRTDMILTTNEFLRYFDMFPFRTEEYRLFQRKVLVADFYTRHTCQGIQVPFHISDWFFFGLTEDIREYFMETRLMTREEQVGFFDVKRPERREGYACVWDWRFSSEQYYCVQAAERHFPNLRMEDWSDWDEGLLRKSEIFIMNNFIVLDFIRHGINLLKYEMRITLDCGEKEYYERGLYTYEIYRQLYESFRKGKGIPPIWDENTENNRGGWMFRKEES